MGRHRSIRAEYEQNSASNEARVEMMNVIRWKACAEIIGPRGRVPGGSRVRKSRAGKAAEMEAVAFSQKRAGPNWS